MPLVGNKKLAPDCQRLFDKVGGNSYNSSMNALISEKGQVTIPKPLREALGLTAGTRLDFREEAGHLVATKVLSQSPVDKWRGRGRLPGGAVTVDDYLGKIRDAG